MSTPTTHPPGPVAPLPPELSGPLPDHTQLPCEDGAVHNMWEHPQAILLTDCIKPVLRQVFPDGQYCIGQDTGIYWRLTDPPLRGVISPDWFLVLEVPPTLGGQLRRSYVLWQEHQAPLIAIEFVSGDGTEEHDQTPQEGKFWIYERRIRPAYYVIHDPWRARLEAFQVVGDRFVALPPNERGHYSIPRLGVELGLWDGTFQQARWPWLRWYDANGRLLPTGEERADQEAERVRRLAERLRELGVNPDEV
jgi:Uma2 family endonuclease